MQADPGAGDAPARNRVAPSDLSAPGRQPSVLTMLLRTVPVLAILALLAGCGDITYQTRYVPRASELSWDKDVEQLPWRPPAVGEDHLVRNGRPAKPMYPPTIPVDVDWPQHGYHFAGDGDAADVADGPVFELTE